MTELAPSAAVWLRGTSQLRRRWRSWLGLALLIGVAGGFLVASVAGARRTTTAYDRLLASARPFDVVLGVGCAEGLEEDACADSVSQSIDEILALPPVADGELVMNFLVPVLAADGFSIQPQEEVLDDRGEPPGVTCFTGNGEIDVLGSPSGRFGTELNRHRFVAGRAADPARADEAVVSVATARRAGIHVGDSLRIVPIDACGDGGSAPDEWPEPFEVTVVGLHVAPGEVQPETGRYLQSVMVTPPLLDKLASSLGPNPSAMVLLRDGATTAELMEAVEGAGIPADVVLSQDEFSPSVRRGLRPDALTLWLLAALGGVATVIVLGQALSRQAWAGADELPALRAIGFTSRDFALVGAVEGAAVALVGGVGTAALAIAASPLFPVGRARVAEPDPGLRVDALAVGAGSLILAVASFVVVVVVARRVAAQTLTAARPPDRPALATVLLGRLGARPPAVVGARMALERGHGALAVPVRAGFTGIAVGVAALVGSLTFGADLEHLLNTPRLVGWNWDVGFFGTDSESGDPDADPVAQAEELIRAARAIPGVERAGYATFFPPSDVPIIEALPDIWPLSFSSGPGSIAPTVTSGRAPAAPDEMLVTPWMLGKLGLEIGDTVAVHGGTGTESGESVPITATVTIVGTGVLPIGDGRFEQTVALTFEGMRQIVPEVGPQTVVVDLAANADRQRTTAALADIGLSDPIDSEQVDVATLVDLDVSRADDLPRLLGTLMAVLAIGVLVHLVYTGVRAGRHDLATLRALGFSRAQVVTTIAWQTTIAVAVPFAAAAVLGMVAGRLVWLAYAERLGVAPETVVAWRPIAGFFVAFLVAANVIGVVIGHGARNSAPAGVLRTE